MEPTTPSFERPKKPFMATLLLVVLFGNLIPSCSSSCSTAKYCEEISFLRECQQSYSCGYHVVNGQLRSCDGGGDCRKLSNDESKCRSYVNCAWSEPNRQGSCHTNKYCENMYVLQECREGYGCSYNTRNGDLSKCYDGSDCRKLGTKEKCEQYTNCGWIEGTGEEEEEVNATEANYASLSATVTTTASAAASDTARSFGVVLAMMTTLFVFPLVHHFF